MSGVAGRRTSMMAWEPDAPRRLDAPRSPDPRQHRMKNVGLRVALLLALMRPAIAQHDVERIACACARDFERLCAQRVPLPSIEDFRDHGVINNCLRERLQSLSRRCWEVIMGRGS
jgi:hypothetical protein